MPQLLRDLSAGSSNTRIGLLVMIPYVVALAVMMIVGRSSDERRERRYHAAIPLTIAAVALALLAMSGTSGLLVSLLLWCVIAAGIYSIFGPFWSLPNEFLTGYAAAAGIAFINSVGNIGGFVGPYTIGAINKMTGTFQGGLIMVAISALFSAVLIVRFRERSQGAAALLRREA